VKRLPVARRDDLKQHAAVSVDLPQVAIPAHRRAGSARTPTPNGVDPIGAGLHRR
jgi:hypothetical protein